jgi:S-adenosylmethionine hydrolase
MARQALFTGLVYDEREIPVEVSYVGLEAYYVVDDNGFLRHIDSEQVDRQVLAVFLQQLEENKELAVEQALKFLGRDDLFTKAAIDASMRNIDMDQIVEQGIPEQARNMMGMLGFRIIINIHGEVVRLDQPAAPEDYD